MHLNAIPGMAESLIRGKNIPPDECLSDYDSL